MVKPSGVKPSGRTAQAIAPAKINLYLHVTGKRDDGYHTLDSLAVFAGIHDSLTATSADAITLAIDGPFGAALPVDNDNLVLRAARALARCSNVTEGAALTLTKRLPIASGIGGGSADAAATLHALMDLWQVRPDAHTLSALALGLGADVPICLGQQAQFMGGIGESLVPAPTLPPTWFVLVNPGAHVATPAVFRARTGPFRGPGRFAAAPTNTAEFAALLAERHNDLTDAALRLSPPIGDVLSALQDTNDCLLARMSGSGATCFGLFGNEAAAMAAAISLGKQRPRWWVKATSMETDMQVR